MPATAVARKGSLGGTDSVGAPMSWAAPNDLLADSGWDTMTAPREWNVTDTGHPSARPGLSQPLPPNPFCGLAPNLQEAPGCHMLGMAAPPSAWVPRCVEEEKVLVSGAS